MKHTPSTSQGLSDFFKQAEERGTPISEAIAVALAMGWSAASVADALPPGSVPPLPPISDTAAADTSSRSAKVPKVQPSPTIQMIATRGVEYTMMFVSLWGSAIGIGILFHMMVDQTVGNNQGSFWLGASRLASALVVVCLPIFILLFLHLKRAELHDPRERQNQSRRKLVRFTMVVSFLFIIWQSLTLHYALLGLEADSNNAQVFVQHLLHAAVTLGVAGAIFGYYWHDEHKHPEHP